MKPPKLLPNAKILVMRYRFIGDTLLSVPFLRNLRTHLPHATIDMLVAPKSGEVLTYCPYVDRFLYYGKNDFHRYEADAPPTQGFWAMAQRLRQERYDAVFLLKRSFSSAALAWITGAPIRVGHNTEGRGWLLSHQTSYIANTHESENYLNLLPLVGIPVHDRHGEGWVSAQERQAVQPYLQTDAPLHIMALNTSAHHAKHWPNDSFIRLCRWFLESTPAQLYFLGDTQDRSMYESIQAALPTDFSSRIVNVAGQTSLLESMAMMEAMNLVVGPDSGTLHMAAAMGRPVVALFGPMNEERWRPLSPNGTIVSAPVSCRPCELKAPCPHQFQCMTTLPVETVIDACKTLLKL